MSDTPVVICAIGITTAVGLSSAETAASVRAATARFEESAILDREFRPFTVAEVPERGLPAVNEHADAQPVASARERRMLRLAARALGECLAPLAASRERVGLCLALPELDTPRPTNGATFLAQLAVQTGGVVNQAASDASHRGRAGGLIAIGQGVLTLQRGSAELIVAGGVDSYHDLFVLATLDKERRVKSRLNADGFVPGEGAAFLLLATEQAARSRGLPTFGRVTPVAMGFETGHLYSSEPYRGDGLALTFQQLVARNVIDAPIADVYASMTGESHWAKEWGVAHIRSKAAFRPDFGIHHPADCVGETGAASGPLMVGLAAMGIRGLYHRAPVLVYGSSDRGSRAAMIVTA